MNPNPSILSGPASLQGPSLLSGPAPAAPTPVAAAPPYSASIPAKPVGVQLRGYGDTSAIRDNIYNDVLTSVQNMQPMENARHRMVVRDAQYIDDPIKHTLKKQKEAILRGGTLGRRLQATLELQDINTGEKVDELTTTLMKVPHMTERGTFVNKGTEYALRNQQRLRSGVFTRRQDNGDLESHVNIMPGKGRSHRMYLEPGKGRFRLKVAGGTASVMPLLRALGANDKEIEEAVGKELFDANYNEDGHREAQKLVKRFLPEAAQGEDPKVQMRMLAEAFEKMEVDPEVTQRTLGAPHANLNKDTILSIMKKLKQVHKGEAEVDDRDSLTYQQFYGPEDLFSERIKLDKDGMQKAMFWKMSGKGKLQGMQSGALQKQVESALLFSGLGQPLEEINPTEVYDKLYSTTRLGEGGIPSTRSVPDEARSVQPSMFGFIDPVRTPESARVGVDNFISRNAMKGSDGMMYIPLKDARTGEEKYVNPLQTARMTIASAQSLKSDMPRIVAMEGGKMVYRKPEQVDMVLEDFESAFSPMANIIPMKASSKAQRMAMGSRMSLAGETEIWITRDSGKLWKGPIENYTHSPGDRSLSVDKQTNQVIWKEVIDCIEHQNTKRMFKVTMKSGISVVATEDHSLVTMGEDYRLEKILTQDLQKYMPIPTVDLVQFAEKRIKYWKIPKGNKHNAREATKLRMTAKLGWVIGLYLAEGYTGKNKKKGLTTRAVFSNICPRAAGRVVQYFAEQGITVEHTSGRPDGIPDRVNVHWAALARALTKQFGDGAYLKKIPTWVYQQSEEVRRAVLQGYMAGDGIFGDPKDRSPRISGGSRSLRLVQDLRLLCSTLGILTTLRGTQTGTGPAGNTVWQHRFSLRKDDLHKLGDSVGQVRKDGLIPQLVPPDRRTARTLPVVGDFRALFLQRTERGSTVRSRAASRKDTLDMASLEEVFGADLCWASKGWSESDVYWDRVDSVEEVFAGDYPQVYDLDMGDGLWVGNGVFVHNTSQATAVTDPESPLVQSALRGSNDRSFEDMYGKKVGATRAKGQGVVREVTPDSIVVDYAKDGRVEHPLYNNFPFNRKSYLHQTASVEPGQRVDQNSLLARSNYTDKDGTMALGKNLRTAYMVWKGANFEDAVVISESAAKKMSGEAMYSNDMELGKKVVTGKKAFLGKFPSRFNRAQLQSMDDDGVVKVGTTLRKGDPMILGMQSADSAYNKTGKNRTGRLSDKAVVWKKGDEGVVTDVVKTNKGYNVITRAVHEMRLGDKISGRNGDKGVVGEIVPDAEMPRNAAGEPMEMLLSPLGIQTRTNPGQLAELYLGLLAKKLGKPIKVEDFNDVKDRAAWAEQQLKENGIEIEKGLYDPTRDRKVKDVEHGYRFFMRLHHTAAGKSQSRGGGGYSMDGSPSKGGDDAAKRLGTLDSNALMSHGASQTLRDMKLTRSEKDDDYWKQYMSGYNPSDVKVPQQFEKFVNTLKASGINVVQEGTQRQIMAMTNKDVKQLAKNRVISSADAVNWDKGLKELPGGLFDPKLTGGHGGKLWSMMKLSEPLPNPAMEEPVRRFLGLTKPQFEKVLSGEEDIQGHGSGSKGMMSALEAIDLDKEMDKARREISSGRKSSRDSSIKRLGYLKAAKRLNLKPSDYMMDHVPVIPPAFRPITVMGNKEMPLISDANYLYKELFDADRLQQEVGKTMGPEAAGNERLQAYAAFKSLVGLTSPVNPKLQQKNVQGLLKSITGAQPKNGMMQRKLLSSTVDNVGRGVVTPNSKFDMDTIGLPEKEAMKAYSRSVVRRLVKQGTPRSVAAKAVENRSPEAMDALREEMEVRPVFVSRAPVLHKYGIMAFRPKLVKGDAIQTSPVIVGPFGMDYDGDSIVESEVLVLTYPSDLDIVQHLPDAGSGEFDLTAEEIEMLKNAYVTIKKSGDVFEGGVKTLTTSIKNFPRIMDSMEVKKNGVVWYEVPAGVEVMSANPETGETGFYPVSDFTVHPDCEEVAVRYKNVKGPVVRVSSDHSLVVVDRDTLEMRKGKPEESLSLLSPVVWKLQRASDTLLTRIPIKSVYAGDRNQDQVVYPPADFVETDFDLGHWMGTCASDVWTEYPGRSMFHYSKTDQGLLSKFSKTCNRLAAGLVGSGIKRARHVDEDMKLDAISSKITFGSGAISRLIKAWFNPAGSKCYTKQLPDFLPQLPEECLWGIFSGLLDGDSTVRLNTKRKTPQFNVATTTTSPRLCGDIMLLCQLLGVRFSCSDYIKDGKKVADVITYSTLDMYKHRDKVTLTHAAKASAWAGMPEPTKDNTDTVPVPPLLAKVIQEASCLNTPEKVRAKSQDYTTLSGLAKPDYIVSRNKAKVWASWVDTHLEALQCSKAKSLPAVDEWLPLYEKWQELLANTALRYEKIVEITKTGSDVDMYDITVPDTKVFCVQSGLVIYDTVNYHVPTSKGAIAEAYEKMLPSRNLIDQKDFKSAVYKPSNEFVGGLYHASTSKSKRPAITFKTVADATEAMKSGKVDLQDNVKILELE